jgi:hypothetical protein
MLLSESCGLNIRDGNDRDECVAVPVTYLVPFLVSFLPILTG